jgi:hypothetical protein
LPLRYTAGKSVQQQHETKNKREHPPNLSQTTNQKPRSFQCNMT